MAPTDILLGVPADRDRHFCAPHQLQQLRRARGAVDDRKGWSRWPRWEHRKVCRQDGHGIDFADRGLGGIAGALRVNLE